MTHYEHLVQFFIDPSNPEPLLESNALVWIDWREDDERIIDYFNAQLDEKIEVSFIFQGKPYGDDIKLSRKDKSLIIPYLDKMTRDITLTSLNAFLAPTDEIRWALESLGSDTLAFMLLKKEAWQALEKIFGTEKVHYYFAPITKDSVMFDLEIDTVFRLLKERENPPL